MPSPIDAMLLQLTLEEPRDLNTLQVVRPEINIVEISATLLKRSGVSAVAAVAEAAPELIVIAGTRTVDNGEIEASMAFRAGAHVVTVLPSAGRRVQDAVHSAAEHHGGWVVVDASAGSDTTAAVRPFPDSFTHFAIRIGHPLSASSERLRRLRLAVHLDQARPDLQPALDLQPDIIAFRAAALGVENPLGETKWIRHRLTAPGLGSPWAPR